MQYFISRKFEALLMEVVHSRHYEPANDTNDEAEIV